MAEVDSVEKNYVIAENGQMVFNPDYFRRLGWKEGETQCFVYADKKRGLLYFLDNEEGITKLPTDQYVCAKPLIGRTFAVSLRRAVSVSPHALEWLGLKIGDRMNQELNLNINGIVAKKVEVENG